MKKKLIATAVAGSLVAPAVMAEQHMSVDPYFRINNALEWRNNDGADDFADIRNVSSRIGIRGSADLGNGMSVLGQYEFSTFTDREGQVDGRGGINDTRIGIVGIEGSFGTITVGNQWSAFYNTAGVNMEPTYTMGYVIYSSQMGGLYRASNTVKYANSFGPVYLEVDGRFSSDVSPPADVERVGGDNGEEFNDGFGIGASFAATDAISLAAAYDLERFEVGDDQERIAVSARVGFGGFWISPGYMTVEQDSAGLDNEMFSIYAGTSLGENTEAWVGYANGDNGVQEPEQFLLHADHRIGGGPLRLFYEGTFVDFDGAAADFDTHLFGMRIDF